MIDQLWLGKDCQKKRAKPIDPQLHQDERSRLFDGIGYFRPLSVFLCGPSGPLNNLFENSDNPLPTKFFFYRLTLIKKICTPDFFEHSRRPAILNPNVNRSMVEDKERKLRFMKKPVRSDFCRFVSKPFFISSSNKTFAVENKLSESNTIFVPCRLKK